MKKLFTAVAVLCLMGVFGVHSQAAEVSVGVGVHLPGASIGIHLPAYPRLVAVPGMPVYYAPGSRLNLFYHDGLFWVFQNDAWYESTWYDGPWNLVSPDEVPLYVLRVPVRYYGVAPAFFGGWRVDLAPRWGEHWGVEWQQRHVGWNRWNPRSAPAAAPLPAYQRNFSGDRYPHSEAEQHELRAQSNFRYEPREPVAQRHYQAQREEHERR